MASIKLTFYKGVPFDVNNENVLLGNSSYSENTFEDFLTNYEINSYPIGVEKFAIEGTDENGMVDVDLSLEPYNANYLKVEQFLDDGIILTKYFFIDSYLMLAPKTFRIYVNIDIWATYCRKIETQVRNALVAQATSFPLPYGVSERLSPTTSASSSVSKTVLVSGEYRIVFHFTSGLYGELAVVSKDEFTKNQAYEEALKMTSFSELKIVDATGINYPINGIDCFVVPSEFIGNISQFASTSILYFTQESVSTIQSPQFYSLSKIEVTPQTPIIYSNEFEFSVKPEESKITWVSTGNVSVQLPFNEKTYYGSIRVAIKNDIGIELYINNQFFNILDDYKVNIAISEFASWYSQNRNAESARKTNETLGIIGSGLGLVGSLASGNVLGTIGSGLNLLQTVQGQRTNDAVIQDRQNAPLRLGSDTNQILKIDKTNGLAKFEIQPDNYYEMKKYNQYYGYIGNQLLASVPYKIMNYDDRFAYYRCETMEIQGEFSMSIKNRIKEMFSSGIRVWQHAKHYLDSFNNKLTQEEIDNLGV